MDAIVPDVSAAVVPVPVDGTVKPVSVEGKLGNRAGPNVVVDTARHGFVFLMADVVSELHIPHLGHQHTAKSSRLHIVVKGLRDRKARQLSTCLDDALVAARRLYHEAPLADVMRDRLLDV